eukprot:1272551-Amphidinium_carterae.1
MPGQTLCSYTGSKHLEKFTLGAPRRVVTDDDKQSLKSYCTVMATCFLYGLNINRVPMVLEIVNLHILFDHVGASFAPQSICHVSTLHQSMPQTIEGALKRSKRDSGNSVTKMFKKQLKAAIIHCQAKQVLVAHYPLKMTKIARRLVTEVSNKHSDNAKLHKS